MTSSANRFWESDSDEKTLAAVQDLNEILENNGHEKSEAYLWQEDDGTEGYRVELVKVNKKDTKKFLAAAKAAGYDLKEDQICNPIQIYKP